MSAANNDIPSVLAASGTTLGTALVSPIFTNADGRGIKVFINCSVRSAGSFTVTLQGVFNGVPYTILLSAALGAATGVTILTVYPGLTAVANVTATDVLPRQWQVTLTPTAFTGIVNIGACVVV